MSEVLYYAIPFFVLLLVVEFLTYRHLQSDGLVGYELRDTRTSLAMGIGNVTVNVVWKFAVVAIYVALYELTPLRLDAGDWWVWVLLFFADDLAYYWFHRVSHESRVFWASHVVHHSSQHYNLSTALRQTWVPMTYLPFWLPLPLLGFAPWMVLLAQSWSLIYQFWLHTERVGRLPRPLEAVLNTPSHHRVHHGANEQYLDRNYGGILVIWDRLFGSFEPEGERVRYGLTTNIETFNPVRVAFHEYIALGRDLRARALLARALEPAAARARLRARGMSHVARFAYEVAPERRAEFEAVYGPDGEWAELFRTGAGYLGTTLERTGEGDVPRRRPLALARRLRALPGRQRRPLRGDVARARAAVRERAPAHLSRRDSRRSLSTRPSVWSRGQYVIT